MTEYRAKSFIKLGTALRYLIDVQEGEPISGDHVLDNIDAVLSLTKELGFSGTTSHARYADLTSLKNNMSAAASERVNITKEEADKLEKIGRRYRDSLFTEGELIKLYSEPQANTTNVGSNTSIFSNLGLMDYVKLIGLSVAILSGTFMAGITLADNEIIVDLLGLEKTVQEQPAERVKTFPADTP